MYCIYKATNLINSKVYIGYTKNFKNRIKGHKNSSLRQNSSYMIHKAIRKYGWDNFKWEVIYESWDKIHCLREIEPLLIEEYNSMDNNFGYNMVRGGTGTIGIKRNPLTEEQKRHISEKTKEAMDNLPEEIKEKMVRNHKLSMENLETRKKMSEAKIGKEPWIKGKMQSIETRQKMSEAKKGKPAHNKGKNMSLESRQKMSEAKKGKPSWNAGLIGSSYKSIEILNSNYEKVGVVNGSKEIKQFGFNPANVYNTISGIQKHHKNYYFRYLETKEPSFFIE